MLHHRCRFLALCLALLAGWCARADARLPSEEAYALLRNDILVTHQAEFAQAVADNADQVIADAYNQLAAPVFWAWRTAVPRGEYLFGTSVDSTTFTFNGNGFVGRTQGELAGWHELFTLDTDTTNPALPKVRDAFADIFSGTGNAAANRTHLSAMSRRTLTRGERLFVTGTGTPASPGVLGWEGTVSHTDIAHCLRGAPL